MKAAVGHERKDTNCAFHARTRLERLYAQIPSTSMPTPCWIASPLPLNHRWARAVGDAKHDRCSLGCVPCGTDRRSGHRARIQSHPSRTRSAIRERTPAKRTWRSTHAFHADRSLSEAHSADSRRECHGGNERSQPSMAPIRQCAPRHSSHATSSCVSLQRTAHQSVRVAIDCAIEPEAPPP